MVATYVESPSVYLIGKTSTNTHELQNFVDSIGTHDWNTNAPSDSEKLLEVYGRLCYNSFAPGLNPNITRIREGNDSYLENIINSQHHSVLEHTTFNFIFQNVSRVFTAELCRHRVGVAISEQSLRYVRLSNLQYWLPKCVLENPQAKQLFVEEFERAALLQEKLSTLFDLDNPDMQFAEKKEKTSAMRRLAPLGLGTTIGWSANVREIMHVINMRTSDAAEEEMRIVFGMVKEIMQKECSNVFHA